MAKTPKPAAAKPATTPAPSATKAPQSAKKPENQLALEAKQKQTPNKALAKKLKEEEEDDDESDSDDMEEMAAFTKKGKKTADPEDEEVDEDDEDAEQDDEEEVGTVFILEQLRSGNQVGFCIPAQSSVNVVGAALEDVSFPLHITNACLGPEAADNDRASLIVTIFPVHHDHDHDHDEDEEDEEEHDHDDEEMGEPKEIVAGTLCKIYAENLQLDLVLDGDFILTNTSTETDIYVTGRVIIGDDDDEDYNEDDYEDEEEDEEDFDEEDEDEDEEDEDTENSRMELSDEDDEEEEDRETREARAMETRKRLLADAAGNASKKAKPVAAAPKVLDVKPAESKKAPAAAAAGKPKGGDKPSADAVKDFIMGELKTKKSIKNTDLGTMVVNKFGMPFKAMGFEEKSLTKFLENAAKGKVAVTADSIKLVE